MPDPITDEAVIEPQRGSTSLTVLLDLSRRLTGHADDRDVARAAVESATPALADCAVVELLADGDDSGAVLWAPATPEGPGARLLDAARALGEARERALRSGEPVRVASPAPASDVLLVPLRSHDEVLGLLTLARGSERAPFGPLDVEVAAAITIRAALAIAAARAAREERLAREQAERTALRFEALRRTAVDMAAATSTADVFRALNVHARTLLGADGALFATPSARPGWMHVLAAGGDDDEVHDLGTTVAPELRLPLAHAYRERRAIYHESPAPDDVADWPAGASLPWRGRGAVAAAPLCSGERSLGALALYFPHQRSFDEDDRALVETLASQAAIVLERVRLYERSQRTAEQQSLLARASEALDGSLTTETALARLVELAVPTLADGGAVFLFEPDGAARAIAVGFRDREHLERARAIAERWPLSRADFGDVAARGEALLFAEVGDDSLDLRARDPEHLAAVRALALRSCVVAPIRVRSEVRGALAFVWAESARYYDESDLELTVDLAHRASTALERTALYAEIRAAEAEAEKSRRLFERIASASPDSLFLVDARTGRCIYVNQLLGHDPEWLRSLGSSIVEELIHPDDEPSLRAYLDRIPSAPEGEVFHASYRVRDAGGTYRWLEIRSLVFARDEQGRPAELLGVARDVTREREREQALRRSEETHRLATEAVRGLVYEWDIDTGRAVLSRGVRDLTGFDASEVPDRIEWWLGRVHADDLAVNDARWHALDEGRAPVSDIQYRVLHRDGSFRHVWDRACVLRDETGRVTRLVGCVIDVTERVRAQEVLEQADRRKTEFIALLGHELRNPLAAVRSAAQLLDMVDGDAAKRARARDVIVRQVGHMARLLDDLLDLSRIERGKLSLRLEPIDLREIVQSCAEDHRPEVERAGATLSVALPSGAVPASGDSTRLAQVLGNLLHNATKFTRPGGHIEVALRASGERAEVQVRDDGIGIAPAALERIFQPFEQDQQGSERAGGLGLGLALVRGLVELHGGQVRAESEGPGRGSTFVVTLPVQAATTAAEAAEEARAAAGRRVLVVEDNEDAAEMLRMLLEHHGHTVEVAHDGPSALVRARAAAPEIVLCDIGLPGPLSGYDVARALRGDPSTRDAKLVALTGYGQDSDQRRAREAGFDRHVTKPVDPRTLDELLVG